MQSMTTIDIPRDNPSTRLQAHPSHHAYYVSKPGSAVLIAADDAEVIATWLESLAADVRSKAFEQSVTAAALSGLQDANVIPGSDDE